MPAIVKNRRKTKKPTKIHSRDAIESLNKQKLIKYCQKNHLPYYALLKPQIVANICAWEHGKKIPYDELYKTWEEVKASDHRMTPNLRRFCFEYASQLRKITLPQWAKRFAVSSTTIMKWLGWDIVREQILAFQEDHEGMIRQMFVQEEKDIIEELILLIRNCRSSETKRKAISDFLGFAGRKNVNLSKILVKQGQMQQAGATATLQISDEELQRELVELEELE